MDNSVDHFFGINVDVNHPARESERHATLRVHPALGENRGDSAFELLPGPRDRFGDEAIGCRGGACSFVSLERRQTMEQEHASKPMTRVPWNKGKLVGAKPPLRPSHVWSIRTKLQIEGEKRDLWSELIVSIVCCRCFYLKRIFAWRKTGRSASRSQHQWSVA